MPAVSSWPEDLRDLMNDKGRFAGSIGPIADSHAYYAGDTNVLNAFLDKLGGLKGTTIHATIPKRDFAIKMKEFDGTDRIVVADWILHVAERIADRPDLERFEGQALYVDVAINPANKVRLSDLDVPLAFDVTACEAYKEFERKHRERQEQESDKTSEDR